MDIISPIIDNTHKIKLLSFFAVFFVSILNTYLRHLRKEKNGNYKKLDSNVFIKPSKSVCVVAYTSNPAQKRLRPTQYT